jgi:hypothetical protein
MDDPWLKAAQPTIDPPQGTEVSEWRHLPAKTWIERRVHVLHVQQMAHVPFAM